THITPSNHSHAFDIYCRPFVASTSDMPELVWSKLQQETQVHELYSLFGFAGFMVIGLVLRVFDPQQKLERRLERPTDTKTRKYDIVLPGPILGGAILAIIVGISVEDAVQGYTTVPAAFYGQSREMGTLTPGKRADMTILDKDIFQVDPMEIADARVEMTIFDGRIVYRHDP
ncbi:MAG: amidohydrolase family protein, partial [Desulfobacterales bacterium]